MDFLMYENSPFLITKIDEECQLYFKDVPSLYRTKQVQSMNDIPFSLSYFYVSKRLPPIANEGFLSFLSKQYGTKKIDVHTNAIIITNDKVIEKQLSVQPHSPILLIRKVYQVKSTIIAFERTYVNTKLKEYEI